MNALIKIQDSGRREQIVKKLSNEMAIELNNLQLTPNQFFLKFKVTDLSNSISCDKNEHLALPNIRILAEVVGDVLLNDCQFDRYLAFLNQYNTFIDKNTTYLREADTQIIISSGILFPNIESRDYILRLNNKIKRYLKKGTIASEKILQDVLFDKFDYWDNRFSCYKEIKMNHGRCDLLLKTKETFIPIELKIHAIKPKDIYQTYEYTRGEKTAILIGKECNQEFIGLAKQLNISIYTLNFNSQYLQYIYLEHLRGTPLNSVFNMLINDIESNCGFHVSYEPSDSKCFKKIVSRYMSLDKLIKAFSKKILAAE